MKEMLVELNLDGPHLCLDDKGVFNITSCYEQSNTEESSNSHPKWEWGVCAM